MDSLDRTTPCETRGIDGLYAELADSVKALPPDRQEQLMEFLNMPNMEAVLRDALIKDPRSHYAIAKEAGVTPDILDRFASSERGLRISTAAKVAAVLGLQLVPIKRKKKAR